MGMEIMNTLQVWPPSQQDMTVGGRLVREEEKEVTIRETSERGGGGQLEWKGSKTG